MKRFSEQLKKKSDTIRMKAHERRDLRDRIVSYMEYHPMTVAQATAKKTKGTESILSEPFKIISIHATYLRNFAGVFALFLVVGVPLIAEKAVPGDVLYPVKVQFNEELRSTLSFSPYAKVEWETQRLERRIAEARLLAEEGKLTQEIEAEVTLAFETHKNAAQKEIAVLRESDSDEADIAEITFASALAVQSEVLENDAQKDGSSDEGRSVATLAGVVAQAHLDAETAQTGTTPSYAKLLARIELETTSAQELFASIKQSASSEEIASIERRLSDIQRKVLHAAELHTASVEQQEVTDVEVEAATSFVASSTDETFSTSSVEADMVGVTTTTATNTGARSETNATNTQPEIAVSAEPDVSAQNKEATVLLRSALTDTRKLISFMTDIDVRANVSIDELVPVVLTEEEELEVMKILFAQTIEMRAEIETYSITGELQEKFALGVQQLDTVLPRAERALQEKDVKQAQLHTNEAAALAIDLLQMGEVAADGGAGTTTVNTLEEEKGTTTLPSVKGVTEILDEI